MAQPLKICLIGAGYWGKNYIKLLQSMGTNFNFIGIVEKSESIKKTIIDNYNIRIFDDITETYELCDCYIIATPVKTHYSIAKDCILQGKNIMVEKPLTDSYEKTKELINLAKSKNIKLMTNFTPIYTEPMKFIKNYIANKLDKIRYISLKRSNLGIIRNDCDVIIDLTCHDISMLLFLVESMPENIFPISKSFINDDIDMVSINMKYPNFISHVYTSRIDNLKQREIVIITEDERITYDDTNTVNPIIINNNNITKEDGKICYNYNNTIIPNIIFKEPLKNQLLDFYNSVINNCDPISNSKLSLNVNKLIENIYDTL
jgi:predicted dehydrogenase